VESEKVREFIHLECSIREDNSFTTEIKERMLLENPAIYGLNK
jgi:hypothetical protein